MESVAMDEEGYWGRLPDAAWGRNLKVASELSGLLSSKFTLGDPNDPRSPFVSIVRFPPNATVNRHAHASPRLEVIVTGSMIIDGRALGPGSIMTADKDEFYGPHLVGPEGCVTVEIMDGDGARRLTFPAPAGDQTVDFEDPGFLRALEAAFAQL